MFLPYFAFVVASVTTTTCTAASDFQWTHRVPSASVDQNVGHGQDIHVNWKASADTHSGVIQSGARDWIGLFKANDCDQNSNMATVTGETRDHIGQNRCFIASQSVPQNQAAGQLIFRYSDTRWPAGKYEVRYFLGDSPDGQGVSCRDADFAAGTTHTQKECEYEYAAKSSPITVETPAPSMDFQTINMQHISGNASLKPSCSVDTAHYAHCLLCTLAPVLLFHAV